MLKARADSRGRLTAVGNLRWRSAYHEEVHSRSIDVGNGRKIHNNVLQVACTWRQLQLCCLLVFAAATQNIVDFREDSWKVQSARRCQVYRKVMPAQQRARYMQPCGFEWKTAALAKESNGLVRKANRSTLLLKAVHLIKSECQRHLWGARNRWHVTKGTCTQPQLLSQKTRNTHAQKHKVHKKAAASQELSIGNEVFTKASSPWLQPCGW